MKAQLEQFLEETKKKGSVLGLSNMRSLMDSLGNVQNTLPIIHIAGTNGKGSVGAFLASVFTTAGLKVGRYTSPAVFDPREVFTVNGEEMSQADYERLLEQIMETGCPATLFEAETAMAFLWFAEQKPDLVLLECGMGGATDATNVIEKPLASVITSISLDHTAFLGPDTASIAQVKGGIIKPGCPVFSAAQDPAASAVLSEIAASCGADFTEIDPADLTLQEESLKHLLFTYRKDNYSVGLESRLSGHYQTMNAALAFEVAFALWEHFFPGKTKEESLAAIADGIFAANWPGRFELLSKKPFLIIDGAHNEGAALELAETIRRVFGSQKLTFVFGILGDKDHHRMLEILLPFAARAIAMTPHNSRALAAQRLAEEAGEIAPQLSVCVAEDAKEALFLAAQNGEPILVCGSLSHLSEIKKAAGDLKFL